MIIYNSYISKHTYCLINSEVVVFGHFHFKRSVYIFLKILSDHLYVYCMVYPILNVLLQQNIHEVGYFHFDLCELIRLLKKPPIPKLPIFLFSLPKLKYSYVFHIDLYNGNNRQYIKYHTKNVGNRSGCFWPLPTKKSPDG